MILAGQVEISNSDGSTQWKKETHPPEVYLNLANWASFSALNTPFILSRDTVLFSNISHFLPVTREGLCPLAELTLLSIALDCLTSSAGTPASVSYERKWPRTFCLLTSTTQ